MTCTLAKSVGVCSKDWLSSTMLQSPWFLAYFSFVIGWAVTHTSRRESSAHSRCLPEHSHGEVRIWEVLWWPVLGEFAQSIHSGVDIPGCSAGVPEYRSVGEHVVWVVACMGYVWGLGEVQHADTWMTPPAIYTPHSPLLLHQHGTLGSSACLACMHARRPDPKQS